MSIAIIRADISHAAVIATIGKRSFRRAFEHLFNCQEELFEYLENSYCPIKLAKNLRKENNIYLLALLEGKPVGFAKVKQHSLNEQIESIAQMELQKIYVLQEHHGAGIGTALLDEIKNLVDKFCPDYVWLDTHISNENAIRLYEKNGFNKIGRHFFTIGTQTFEYHVMGLPVNCKTTNY